MASSISTTSSPIINPKGLTNSFDRTNLDLENPGSPNKDLQTQYPATSTGTPTDQANPGAAKNYVPKFTPTNTYLNQIIGNSNSVGITSPNAETISSSPILQLVSSLNKTNLDIENPGSPKKDYSTQYPKNISGTPTVDQNPVGPAKLFDQKYTPENPYDNQINNKIVANSVLSNNPEKPTVLAITNLDVENPSVTGGPAKALNDPTIYPVLNSGIPTSTQNPANKPKKFEQLYIPSNTYLEQFSYGNRVIKSSPLSGDPLNPEILNISNLDNSNSKVIPYKSSIDDPTTYPLMSTGRTEIRAWPNTIPGAISIPAKKFDPKYDFSKKYEQNIEVDLGIAPNVKEPEKPKPSTSKDNKDVKGVEKLVQSLTSFFGK